MTPRRVVIVALFGLFGFGAPLAAQPSGEDVLSVSRRIDAAIVKRAKADGIAVSGPAADATFLRRLSLDLTGKIPELTFARDSLDNDDPHKRSAVIERFLSDPRFARHFASQLGSLLLQPNAEDDRAQSEPSKSAATRAPPRFSTAICSSLAMTTRVCTFATPRATKVPS